MNHRPLALSFCITLLMVSSCDSGDVGNPEYEDDDDYGTPTPTPDNDYTATFEYYDMTGSWPYHPTTKVSDSTEAGADGEARQGRGRMAVEPKNSQASVVGQLTPVVLLGLAVCQMWD